MVRAQPWDSPCRCRGGGIPAKTLGDAPVTAPGWDPAAPCPQGAGATTPGCYLQPSPCPSVPEGSASPFYSAKLLPSGVKIAHPSPVCWLRKRKIGCWLKWHRANGASSFICHQGQAGSAGCADHYQCVKMPRVSPPWPAWLRSSLPFCSPLSLLLSRAPGNGKDGR